MSEALYDAGLRRETPLAVALKARIRREGPIGVDQFMTACLQDGEHGYYRGKAAIGQAGDFITAPEISQIFGELIGLWCAVVWRQMGEPAAFDLIELGPGRGTLMADALRAARIVKGFAPAAQVTLVETSDVLREAQAGTLRGAAVAALNWREDFPSLSRPAIVIGNEFLDTAAVRQFEMTARGWMERVVTLGERGDLQFGVRETSEAAALGLAWPAAREGDVRELRVDPLPMWLARPTTADAPMAVLLIDYGQPVPQLGETLQAVRQHRFEHPLTSPGEADLSCQVDFGAVAAAVPPSLVVDGPCTQAEFLGRLGIIERASRLMAANEEKSNAIEMGVARLMNPQGMGGRFKVMGIRSPFLAPLPGLQEG